MEKLDKMSNNIIQPFTFKQKIFCLYISFLNQVKKISVVEKRLLRQTDNQTITAQNWKETNRQKHQQTICFKQSSIP